MRRPGTTFLRDALFLMGAACLVYGAWLAWAPLGMMLGGLVMAGFGVLWELDLERRKELDERNRRGGL